MNQTIDEKIRVILVDNDIDIPKECLKRMDDTISGLSYNSKQMGKHKWQRKLRYVAAVLICLFMTSITAFAAVDYIKKRMENLTKEEKDDYYQGLQNSTAGADSFSRELTETENAKMEELKVKYKNGQFPAKSLTIVKTQGDTDKRAEFYFVEDKSLFVMPSRELTEEEMLEMIDFYYCRDYSLMEKTKQENKSEVNSDKAVKNISKDKNSKDDDKAMELAKKVVSDIYGVNCEGFDNAIEYDDKRDVYTVTMKDSNRMLNYCVTLDSSKKEVLEINLIQKDDYSVFGISADRKKIIAKYKDALDIVTLKLKITKPIIKSTCEYNVCKDETLARGFVSYLFEMEDGTGYVVKYSCAYDAFYDIFETDYNKFRQTIDHNESYRKKSGLEREIIQME